MDKRAGTGETQHPAELFIFVADSQAALRTQLHELADRMARDEATTRNLTSEALRCAEAAHSGPATHRLAIIADDATDLARRLARALQALEDKQRARFNLANRVLYEDRTGAGAPEQETALLFPGFGAWHPTLVADLYRDFRSVRAWVAALEPATRSAILGNPFLFPPDSAGPAAPEDDPARAFVERMGAVLAGNLALYTLLCEGFGLRSAAMVGHSYGEHAALMAAGMLDGQGVFTSLLQRMADALRAAYRKQWRGGAMLALPAASWAALEGEAAADLHLALDNCPQQVVIYGPVERVAAVEARMQAAGTAAFRLAGLDQPVHTPLFPIAPETLREIYAGIIRPRAAGWMAPIYSCTTTERFPNAPEAVRELLGAQWRAPVRFAATLERLAAEGIRTFVEVGPGGRLSGFVRDTLVRGVRDGTPANAPANIQPAEISTVASNIENRDTLAQLQLCLAQLFVRGHALDLRRLITDRIDDTDPDRVEASQHLPIATPLAPQPPPPDRLRPDLLQPDLLPPDAQRRQQQAILEQVLAEAAEILGLSEAESLDAEQGFFDMGMGSLQAVELAARLARRFGLPLAQTAAFDYPTPRTLAIHLHDRLHPTSAVSNPREGAGQHRPESVRGIAVTGMGCRFPGGFEEDGGSVIAQHRQPRRRQIASPAAFWEFLCAGGDAVGERPAGRWPEDTETWVADTDEAARLRNGGFLDAIEGFDAAFFGITPREAGAMDPQQRLLLEVVWEALEDAAINPRTLAGSATGVFVGISHADYALRLTPAERLTISGHLGTGNSAATAAGRIAFTFGFTGPCVAVDTACSSSLVALHMACRSLQAGECDTAIVAGVNLLVSPESGIMLSRSSVLSASGRCHTFDAAADGYVRGEGCGVVVLRRLADAQSAGDAVRAVVLASAVNHDGRTSGLTVPSGPAQQAVVRRALAEAGIAPDDVACVECHGTGTSLGDPIEVQALGEVFAPRGEGRAPLQLGSVKTNIGHLEAAAGVAGFMKLVLQLQHGELVPSLHLHTPNPRIDWPRLPLAVCTQRQPWPAGNGPRIGGVSSFGISGTNAHAIVCAPPLSDVTPPPVPAPDTELPAPAHSREDDTLGLQLLTLSARSPEALAALTGRTATALEAAIVREAKEPGNWAALACTSTLGRAHLEERLALVCASPAEALEQLREGGRITEGTGDVSRASRPRIAFLCSGQGSQLPGMARGLMRRLPLFRSILEACDAGLRPHLGRSLLEVIHAGESATPGEAEIHQTIYAQPALFAVEYALAQVWQAWGVQPDFLLGHSIGEYVAACLAGVFSVQDALRVVAARGRLMQSLPAGGGMLAVMAGPEEIAALLGLVLHPDGEREGGKWPTLSVAALNGPASTVLSGALEEVARAAALLGERQVRTSRLTVSHAFHSPLMEPILADFARVAESITYAPPQIPLATNRSGRFAAADRSPHSGGVDDLATPEYWVRQLREPVHFAPGLQTLLHAGCNVLLEVGPRPVLTGMGQQMFEGLMSSDGARDTSMGAARLWLASLHPPADDERQMLTTLAALYERGCTVDWEAFHRSRDPVFMAMGASAPRPRRMGGALPTYPFQRQRYWIEAPATRNNGPDPGSHGDGGRSAPLLGLPVDLPGMDIPGVGEQRRFSYRPTAADLALFARYLQGPGPAAQGMRHGLLPLSALMVLLHGAGRACHAHDPLRVANLRLARRPPWKLRGDTVLQTVLTPRVEGGHAAAIYRMRLSEEGDAGQSGSRWELLATAQIEGDSSTEPDMHSPAPRTEGAMQPVILQPQAQANLQPQAQANLQPQALASLQPQVLPVEEFYAMSSRLGMDYGAPFRTLRALEVGSATAVARVQVGEAATKGSALGPVLLLEGAMQALGALLFRVAEATPEAALHLMGASAVHVDAITFVPGASDAPAALPDDTLLEVLVTLGAGAEEDAGTATLTLRPITSATGTGGQPLLHVQGLRLRAPEADSSEADDTQAAETATGMLSPSPLTVGTLRRLPEPLRDLHAAAAEDRPLLARRRVRKIMQNVLGIPRAQPLSEDLPFNQMGVDSIIAMRMRLAVLEDYHVEIPLARFVAELGVASLAETILEGVVRTESTGAGSPGSILHAGTSDAGAAGEAAGGEWVEGEL